MILPGLYCAERSGKWMPGGLAMGVATVITFSSMRFPARMSWAAGL